jgi:protein TonB
MFLTTPSRRPEIGPTWLSLTAHAVALAVLLFSVRLHPVHVSSLPGTASGTHVSIAYLPGRAPAPATHALPKIKPRAIAPAEFTPPRAVVASVPPPPELHLPPLPHLTITEAAPDPSSGSDSWGSGSVQIALTTYSPSPAPDLSVLPHGVQGDVVVDITIDPSGKVADLAVLHTLGYGIESNVIGILKTWTFRPATKDGTPIASVQELHFHFGPV